MRRNAALSHKTVLRRPTHEPSSSHSTTLFHLKPPTFKYKMGDSLAQSDPHLAVSKLKQQNAKLRTELETLTKILDGALLKQRQAQKESKRPNFSSGQNRQLAQIHAQISKLKRERTHLQLSANVDNNTTDLENQLVFLKRQLRDLESQKGTLGKMQRQQEKSANSLDSSESTYKERSKGLKEEIKKAKDEYREIRNRLKSEENKWKIDHQRMVSLDERIREVKNRPKKAKEAKPPKTEIEEVNKRIKILKDALSSDERIGKRAIVEAEHSAKAVQDELRALQERLRGREEESQLKDIKIKELQGTVRGLEAKIASEVESLIQAKSGLYGDRGLRHLRSRLHPQSLAQLSAPHPLKSVSSPQMNYISQSKSPKKKSSKGVKRFYLDISNSRDSASPTKPFAPKLPRHPEQPNTPTLTRSESEEPVCRRIQDSRNHSSKLLKLKQKPRMKQQKPDPQMEVLRSGLDSESATDFLTDTINNLKASQDLPISNIISLISKQVSLPGDSSKKSVIFDMDETLVHATPKDADVYIAVEMPTGGVSQIGIKVRPFAVKCLKEAAEIFEVIVFTASHKNYADAVLDYLDPSRSLVRHRLYREHCQKFNSLYVKDLRVLLNRRLENVVIVDNSCLAFAYQLDNGIPIRSWFGDPNDREMQHLMGYLRRLQGVADVREYNRRHFRLYSWEDGPNGHSDINLSLFGC